MGLTIGTARVRVGHVALVAFVFVATRGLALVAGFHYLGNESVWLVQLLDLEILHHHLLRGLLNLHGQPPLFNALIGVAEKLGGGSFGQVVLGFQLLLSLAAGIAVYLTLVGLEVGERVGLAVSLVLLLNPSLLLFEFDALYTVMVYALHCFIGLALVSFVRTRRAGALWWVMGLVVAMTLLRSSYQWVWVGAMFGVLWWQMPEERRRILRVGVVGLGLALVWPVKNYVMFRHFASSTWGPYSLSRHWPGPPYEEPVKGWVRAGILPSFNRPPVQMEADWLDRMWPVAATGFPELDNTAKPDGAPNWNALSRLRMHDQQAKDDGFLLRHDARGYVETMVLGTLFYFRPASDYSTLGYPFPFWEPSVDQYQRMFLVDRWVNAVCCGIFRVPVAVAPGTGTVHLAHGGRVRSVCLGAVLANLVVFGCLVSFWRRSFWDGAREQRVVAMVLTFTIVYMFAVASVFEVGENMRFRFETEALVFVVMAVFLRQVWDRRRARHAE